MPAQIITPDDLKQFKEELLNEIRNILRESSDQKPQKKWLRSSEVRKLLGISPGTLQNMRINGTLPFTKVGGIIYYDYDVLSQMLHVNV